MDFRPGFRFSVRNRRFDHWTPQYLRYRIQAAIRARFHPHEPSLTPSAVQQIEEILRPDNVGVEWGSGNTTPWFARRTKHLTSFETNPPYYEVIAASLIANGLSNVDYRLIAQDYDDDEQAMHRHPIVRAAYDFGDETLDYALIDSAPRGCLCAAVVAKLKRGGLLILDNANWYLPPPADIHPPVTGSVSEVLGTPGSRVQAHECWPAFARRIENWQAVWSSDGIQMTLLLIKP